MKKISHREYLARLRWLEDQWNEPSRSDFYLMQIAQHVAGMFSKKVPKLSEFKIPFKTPGQKTRISKEQATIWSKMRWFGALGMGRKKLEEMKARRDKQRLASGDRD